MVLVLVDDSIGNLASLTRLASELHRSPW